jgi:hypothetical protein
VAGAEEEGIPALGLRLQSLRQEISRLRSRAEALATAVEILERHSNQGSHSERDVLLRDA